MLTRTDNGLDYIRLAFGEGGGHSKRVSVSRYKVVEQG